MKDQFIKSLVRELSHEAKYHPIEVRSRRSEISLRFAL